MIKLWKRLSSKEFQVMFGSGIFFSSKRVSIVVKPDFIMAHVGFAIKKGKKSSVERNYYKRLLREAFIDVQCYVPTNWSIILIANPRGNDFKLDTLRLDLLGLLDTAKASIGNNHENLTSVSH